MGDVALKEIVMVEVPEGVTIGGGGVIAALPPPQPANTKAVQKIATKKTPQKARRFLRAAGWNARRCLLKNASKKKSRASKIGAGRGTRESGGMRSGMEGGNAAGPLVVTVTLKVAVPLARETLAGTWQTAPRGAPLQLKATVPLKPEPGVS